jgi:hypothetical protein
MRSQPPCGQAARLRPKRDGSPLARSRDGDTVPVAPGLVPTKPVATGPVLTARGPTYVAGTIHTFLPLATCLFVDLITVLVVRSLGIVSRL